MGAVGADGKGLTHMARSDGRGVVATVAPPCPPPSSLLFSFLCACRIRGPSAGCETLTPRGGFSRVPLQSRAASKGGRRGARRDGPVRKERCCPPKSRGSCTGLKNAETDALCTRSTEHAVRRRPPSPLGGISCERRPEAATTPSPPPTEWWWDKRHPNRRVSLPTRASGRAVGIA